MVSVYEIYNNFIHSLLNIRGRVFVWEEFCPAPESNMPLNNEIGPIVDCHFIKISQKARLSTNWQPSSPISIMVLNYQKLTSDVGRCMYQIYWTYLKLLLFLIIFKEKVQTEFNRFLVYIILLIECEFKTFSVVF